MQQISNSETDDVQTAFTNMETTQVSTLHKHRHNSQFTSPVLLTKNYDYAFTAKYDNLSSTTTNWFYVKTLIPVKNK